MASLLYVYVYVCAYISIFLPIWTTSTPFSPYTHTLSLSSQLSLYLFISLSLYLCFSIYLFFYLFISSIATIDGCSCKVEYRCRRALGFYGSPTREQLAHLGGTDWCWRAYRCDTIFFIPGWYGPELGE